MADDIFLSPEEQDERARQWFKDNGLALAAGIGLGLAAVFGYNSYKDSVQANAEQASALYAAAVVEIQDSELSSIEEQLETLKTEHAKSSYASKAALLRAKQLAVSDLPAAYEQLQWVVDNAPESGLQHTARIRQAKIKLALNETDTAKALASHTPTQGFESHYQEVLGDISVQGGDEVAARSHYQAALDAMEEGQNAYAQVLNIKIDRLPVPATAVSEDSAGDVSVN